MRRLTSIRHAFGFLTIIPIAPVDSIPTARSAAYFPLVGLALGGFLAGLDLIAREILPLSVVCAILLVSLIVVTRAIHIEGFLDCCDGLVGGGDKEDRLRILKDSRVGAFAVVGGVSILLLKWSLLVGAPQNVRLELLILFPCLSRFAMLATMYSFNYVREIGLGTSLKAGLGLKQIALGLATAAGASALFMGIGGVVLLALVLLVSVAIGSWISKLIGGMTGDSYGAVNEIAEVTTLLIAVALVPVITTLFRPPLW